MIYRNNTEVYEYEYNLQNRLSRVWKNGETVAEFIYDAGGMRIRAEEELEESQGVRTSYFVYGYAGKVLLEESSDTDTSGGSSEGSNTTISHTSYIYAFSKTFAKVDGVINTATIAAAEISYFHHDNLGSTRLMTDQDGKVIMDQDYLPFGGDLPGVGQVEVQNDDGEGYKYTGQKEVVSIGLYYYGARYYDPEIGRFITADTYDGELKNPQSQNLYVYVMNNPMIYVDPTGNTAEVSGEVSQWDFSIDWQAFFSAIGSGLSTAGKTTLGVLKVPVAFLLISQPLNEGAELYHGLTNEQIIQLQDQERNSTSTPPMEPVPDWLKNPGIRDFPIDAQRSLDILDFPLGDVPDTSTPPMIPDRLTSPNIWDMPYDDARSIDDLVMMMSGVETKYTYRTRYLEQHPDLSSGWQVHHSLPQTYDDILKSAGINIHEVQYLRGVDPEIHKLITKEWISWDRSLARNPTLEEVMEFQKHIDDKYGEHWHKNR